MPANRSLSLLLSATVLLAACSKKDEAPTVPAAEPAAAAAPEAAATAAAAPALVSAPAPAGAPRSFAAHQDGATGCIAIAPAGSDAPASGHHHLVIDAELPAVDAPIPANANYVHFGKGQTETSIELTPGTHTLQLVFANGQHLPFNPQLASEKITVTVTATTP
jgi:hypothetical protein